MSPGALVSRGSTPFRPIYSRTHLPVRRQSDYVPSTYNTVALEGYELVTLTDAHSDLMPGDIVAIQPRNALYFDESGARIV